MSTYRLAVFINVIVATLATVRELEMLTLRKGKFQNTADIGVTPIGRTSLHFKIKSCGNVVIALSNIERINNHAGKYFLIYLGKRKNKESLIADSCFKCKAKTLIKKTVLHCNKYMPFWLSWDNKGRVKIGEGGRLGERILLEYKTDSPFEVVYSQVTSISPSTKWRFLLYDDVKFVAPRQDGSTIVRIPEDLAIGSVIYQITINTEIGVTMENSSTHFRLNKNVVMITDKLDYEKQRFYIIRFKTKELDVTATLTILVEDVNDELPEVVLGSGVRIPEELPVGFVIGGVFTASDGDTNDSLTYTLEGADSRYFSLVGEGLLKIEQRIDRDGVDGRQQLSDLKLHVEDEAHHVTSHILNIIIDDINDNAPICASGLFTTTIKHDATVGKAIMNIPCIDDDSGKNGRFSLGIVPNLDDNVGHRKKKFWLAGFDLYADIELLRRESSRRQSSPYILKLLAVDMPKNGQPHTGTAVVIINLEHKKRQRVNDHKPTWRHPVPDSKLYFQDQRISEGAAPGTVVMRFSADDEDPGTMVAYMIHSIKADGDSNATGPFMIDLKSGVLRTSGSLDCDQATGGVKSYTILLIATDGEHIINGFLRVLLDNVNDNKPVFSSTLHTASVKTINSIAKPITEFHVTDNDKGPPISLSLPTKDYHYFRLIQESEKWLLKFRIGIALDDSSIPHVVVVTASDNANPPQSSRAIVVINDIACTVGTNPSCNETTANSETDVVGHAAVPGTENVKASDAKSGANTARSMDRADKHGVQLGVDYTEGSQSDKGISNIPAEYECPPVKTTSAESARTSLYLKVACAVEGLIIVMTMLLVLAKRCGCLKKTSAAAGQPERKEPLGCENAMRIHERRQSVKKKDGKTHVKSGPSPGTATPKPDIRVDSINELLAQSPKKVHIVEPTTKMVALQETPTTSQMIIDDEMALSAKNKFLGLRKKARPVDPVKLYSDPCGVSLYDNDLTSVARTRFLELIKQPAQQSATDTSDTIFVAKDKFLHFLKQAPSDAPHEMLTYLDESNTEIMAIAKGKFIGLTQERFNAELDLTKESQPLDIVSLLDGSCFEASEDTMITVAKDKFLTMLKENDTRDKLMTNNDAILEYAAGYNPSKQSVYIAKNKFFELLKKDGAEDEVEDEVLAMSKSKLMELLSSEVDPWSDDGNAVMKYVCGADPENGDMFIKKETFMSLIKNIDKADSDMIAVTKPKLAELLHGNSENPKCNDTLNYYITAVSPATGMVYMFKDKFTALVRANGKRPDELLEVDIEQLHRLPITESGKGNVESLLKSSSFGCSESKKLLYVAKKRFTDLTYCKGNGPVASDSSEVLEVSKETLANMIQTSGGMDIIPVAVNNDSFFVIKEDFLTLSQQGVGEEDLVELSKERVADIVDSLDGDTESFLKKHALAFTPSPGKVYIARNIFMSLVEEKRSKTSPQDLNDEDELLYIPQEQIANILQNTKDQRTDAFIQRNTEAINPVTGAVFMARKRFLSIADKERLTGVEGSEIVNVAKDTLLEMLPEGEDPTSETDKTLSKYALAFSSDNSTVYIAKRKFVALRKAAITKLGNGSGESRTDANELIAITAESLSQMGEQEDCHSVDGLVKKYATAFNPQTKVAYLDKHTFMNMAKRQMSACRESEADEIVAVPKETLAELTAGEGNKTAKARIMDYAMAFNDSQNSVYVAKSRFMKLMEQKAVISDESGESDMISISQKKLDEMVTASGDNTATSGSEESVKQLALAVNPLTKTVYMARKKFADLAKKYVQTSGKSNRENDIVALSETQVSHMLKGATKNTSDMLRKYALAFSKGNDKVYFVKKKFQELASSVKKAKAVIEKSAEPTVRSGHRAAEVASMSSREVPNIVIPTNGNQNEHSISYTVQKAVDEAQGILPTVNTPSQGTLSNLHAEPCPADSDTSLSSSCPNPFVQLTHKAVGLIPVEIVPTQNNQQTPQPTPSVESPVLTAVSEFPPTPVNSATDGRSSVGVDMNSMLMHREFNVLDEKTTVSDSDTREEEHSLPEHETRTMATSSEYASDVTDSDSDTSGCTTIHNPRVVLTITDDLDDNEELDAVAKTQLSTQYPSMLGRLPNSRESKSKKKVKSWDPEVRDRLYATKKKICKKSSMSKKRTRKGSKLSPELSSSEIGGHSQQNTRRPTAVRRKSAQVRRSTTVHPEMDVITSETDDCSTGRPLVSEADLNTQRIKAKSKKDKTMKPK